MRASCLAGSVLKRLISAWAEERDIVATWNMILGDITYMLHIPPSSVTQGATRAVWCMGYGSFEAGDRLPSRVGDACFVVCSVAARGISRGTGVVVNDSVKPNLKCHVLFAFIFSPGMAKSELGNRFLLVVIVAVLCCAWDRWCRAEKTLISRTRLCLIRAPPGAYVSQLGKELVISGQVLPQYTVQRRWGPGTRNLRRTRPNVQICAD